jgi:hypothetical protein
MYLFCEISGCRVGKCDDVIVHCNAMSSTLKMGRVGLVSSETSVSTFRSTRCHNAEQRLLLFILTTRCKGLETGWFLLLYMPLAASWWRELIVDPMANALHLRKFNKLPRNRTLEAHNLLPSSPPTHTLYSCLQQTDRAAGTFVLAAWTYQLQFQFQFQWLSEEQAHVKSCKFEL